MKFRPATVADLEPMNRLIMSAKASWGYSVEQLDSWREELTINESSLARCNFQLVEDSEHHLLGVYSTSAMRADKVELEDCWVAPSAQSRGVGKAMIEHLKRELPSRGVTKVHIIADPNALGFYIRMGAEQVAEKPSSVPGRMLPILELNLILQPV